MNYRTNEDKQCSDTPTSARYNHIFNVDDISNESGEVIEPVTLQEMKDYLRLEGFSTDAVYVTNEEPIALTLLEDATSVQDDLLIDATILTLAREGTIYTKSAVVGNRKFVHNETTGTVSFENAGGVGGETLDITYGYSGASSGDDAFDYDNDLLEEMITEARTWVERYTGLHLIAKTLQVVLLNQAGMIELPGPVTGTIVIENKDGETIDSDTYTFIGSPFPKLESTFSDRLTLEYDAGYTRTTIPKGLKGAIKAYVAYAYEHRGEEIDDKALTESAARKARPYRRLSPWA